MKKFKNKPIRLSTTQYIFSDSEDEQPKTRVIDDYRHSLMVSGRNDHTLIALISRPLDERAFEVCAVIAD